MEREIISYTILSQPTLAKLSTSVNNYIQAGWQPLGAPFFVPKLSQTKGPPIDEHFAQALVKYSHL